MRYVIYGAGAIGGTIGGKLFQHGHDVTLICRSAHLEACRERGLALHTPDGTDVLRIPVAASPAEIDWRPDDIVILAMKSQDTEAALVALRSAAGDVPIVCAQNGVANERIAARMFSRVYGMVVWMPATHLKPGEVFAHSSPVAGVLDAGLYPSGTNGLIEQITSDLTASGFSAIAQPDIMRYKYAKLLSNLANIVQALCGDSAAGSIVTRLRDEALMAYDAAGISVATPEELSARTREVNVKPVSGMESRLGGSTWQSLTRGGSLETDYLNGEIALLGALHGVPTPMNRILQLAATEATRDSRPVGSFTTDELLSRLPG